MSETVLLTGATGFLGMEVLVRLLEQPDTEVIALVRADHRGHAATRMAEVFAKLFDEPPPSSDRVTALPGDVAASGLGLSERDHAEVMARVDSIIHCAASIAFDLPLAEAIAINADGARRVLALARQLADRGRLRRIVHVSTAYVAGRHRGCFHESDLDVGQDFRNSYERSKFEAERRLRADAGDLPLVVARPSVVVGDSHSGWTPAFNVIYWPLRAFSRGLLDRVPVDPAGVMDIVPVDYVADGILALHQLDRVRGTIHLVAGQRAIGNAQLIKLASRQFDRPAPELVPDASPAGEQADVYVPYFDVHTVFDDRRARELLVPLEIEPPRLPDYFAAMIDFATTTRWGKRTVTRESARARARAADPRVTATVARST